ncbi:DUF4199 domain-containing protein [Algoriphagus sp. CAU 1675]|uniref:DUF4199 domain-containing protein n=1 Tax=Algoriphagus sp. CAU 1675 TaxID=3032597 RepID=UPI0023DABB4A|nr:DUF4199 domain-containing protein [Algoriphagus sp. CAU 1675]MDF2156914.1 DUF4199 domain-containing protein [Algoriphagus sp. CAU 1675]
MKNWKIEFKWGAIFLLTTLLWMVMEKSLGWHDEKIADHAVNTNFFAIPAILVYVFALLDKKKNFYQGTMNFKQGFVSGMVITSVVAVLSPLNQYIISTVITPEYFSNVIEYSVKNGLMTEEAATSYFNLNYYMLQSVIGAVVMGTFTSLALAFLMKSKAR